MPEQIYIESVKRGRETGGSIPGCRLVLSDGSTYFILLSDGDELGCVPGKNVDGFFRNMLQNASLRRDVSEKALDLLARRDHSEMELKLKLENRFIFKNSNTGRKAEQTTDDLLKTGLMSPGEIIREVLVKLESLGYLDDYRFAVNWGTSRLKRHPESRSSLESGLRSRGVSGSISGKVIRELDAEGAFVSALNMAGEKFLRIIGPDREKILKKLKSRGFSYGEITGWMNSVFHNEDED